MGRLRVEAPLELLRLFNKWFLPSNERKYTQIEENSNIQSL